jgi:hypothetical protein
VIWKYCRAFTRGQVCALEGSNRRCRQGRPDIMEENREEKTQKSAFDSTTFDAEISILVDSQQHGDCGAATISPSGRDVAIAS